MKIQFHDGSVWETTSYDLLRTLKGTEKYDGTLDQLSIEFLSTIAPKERFTKCRVLLAPGGIMYDDYVTGKPSNYREFVILSSDVQVHTGYTKHAYTLVEPTYVLKYVRMESLTFTSIPSITVKELVGSTWTDVTYTQDAISIHSMLERILKVTRVKTTVEDNSWVNRIRIMDTSLLSATAMNSDDEFKENTLYDAITKIARYLGRVPVLYFGKSTQEYDLWFERKDGLGIASVDWATFSNGAQGYVLSQSADQGADTVVSDTENMISATVTNGIAQDWYGYTVYDDEVLIPVTDTKNYLELPQNISEVVKLRRLFTGTNVGLQVESVFSTIPCYEEKVWKVLNNTTPTFLKDNSAYFIEGQNKIAFGDKLNQEINDNRGTLAHTNLFGLTYYPAIDGKVISTKNGTIGYETTLNQSDSMVDAGTFGNMLREYIATNGNSDITLSKYHGSFTDIYSVGTPVSKDRTTYIVTSFSYQSSGEGFQVTYQLNKNATKRHENVRASQRIREYGVPYDNTQIRYTHIIDSIAIGISATTDTASTPKYFYDKSIIFAGLLSQSQQASKRNDFPQLAFLKTSSSVNKVGTGSVTKTAYGMLGYSASRVGHSVLLNVKAKDNAYLGKRINASSQQSFVSYSDPFGQVEEATIVFAPYLVISSDIFNKPDGEKFYTDDYLLDEMEFAITYPTAYESIFDAAVSDKTVAVNLTSYKKDAREVLNFTYQLEMFGKNNAIVHDRLVDRSGLLGKNLDGKQLYFVVSNTPIGENDVIPSTDVWYPMGSPLVIAVSNPTIGTNYLQFSLSTPQNIYGDKTISLCYYDTANQVYLPLIHKNNFNSSYMSYVYLNY